MLMRRKTRTLNAKTIAAAKRGNVAAMEKILDYFRPKLQDKAHEECHLMFLRNNLTYMGSIRVSQGGITSSAVDVRQVLREAILRQCTAIVFCHNHPSGTLVPSKQDKELTHRLVEACKAVDIALIDHVIVSSQGYYSFSEEGTLY